MATSPAHEITFGLDSVKAIREPRQWNLRSASWHPTPPCGLICSNDVRLCLRRKFSTALGFSFVYQACRHVVPHSEAQKIDNLVMEE